jgi:hypothetical protein
MPMIADRVELARRGANDAVICRLRSGWAVIGDVQFLPGYCLLLADPVDCGGCRRGSTTGPPRRHTTPRRTLGCATRCAPRSWATPVPRLTRDRSFRLATRGCRGFVR